MQVCQSVFPRYVAYFSSLHRANNVKWWQFAVFLSLSAEIRETTLIYNQDEHQI